jgi:uncharacterized protein (DUF4415 family)
MAKKSSASSRPEKLVSWKAEDILSKPLTKRQRAMMQRLATMPDSEIDYSDAGELTAEQLASAVRFRERTKTTLISLRVRNDVLEWLKSKGPGHLTRLNDILTNVMEAERRLKRA